MIDNTIHDTIIIGSGPAGYTAAIYAARAGLKPGNAVNVFPVPVPTTWVGACLEGVTVAVDHSLQRIKSNLKLAV